MPSMARTNNTEDADTRVPPNDPEAEKSLLGAMMLAPDTVIGNVDAKPEYFYDVRNATVCRCLLTMQADGQAIDPVTVSSSLEGSGQLGQAGGADHIWHIMQAVPHASHARYYSGIVKEKWQRRQVIARCELISSEARLPESDITYVIANSLQALSEANSPEHVDFGIIDSRTFAESDFRTTFLIDGIMTEGQPQLYSGPSKAMKTSTLVDQCCSLASGTPFLGQFSVPAKKRVLLLSSESGTATLQETAVRICQSKGIDLAELGDCLHWGFRPPMLTDVEHIASLKAFVRLNAIDVVAIDPAYLSMNLVGNEASNQFAVGAVLMSLTRLQADTGCTPVLASHFRMHMKPGSVPTLDDVAGAGFGQWARQWVLLNREAKYDPNTPGHHELLMAFGGSAGHCGVTRLMIDEGAVADGRFWSVGLSEYSEAVEDPEEQVRARQERKRVQEDRTRENHRVAILRSLRRFPDGASKTQIRECAGLSSRYFEPVFQDLLQAMEVEPCEFSRGLRKDGTQKLFPGFRVVDPASRLHPTSGASGGRTQPDTPGHCPTVSERTGLSAVGQTNTLSPLGGECLSVCPSVRHLNIE